MTTWIVMAIVAVVLAVAVVLYNRLVKARQMASEAWSGIDVQLKRRAELIPNLVATVKGYAAHERGLFESVTRLRTEAETAAGDVAERGRAEKALSAAISRLMAVAEAYPDIKASENFKALQGALASTEDEIQMARRYYNGAVRNLNVLVQSFPSTVVAQLFGFQTGEFFEVDDADRALPEVSFRR